MRWPNVESKLVKGNPSDFTKFKVLLAKVYVYIYYISSWERSHIPFFRRTSLDSDFCCSKKGVRRTNLSICCERIMGPKKRLPNPGSDSQRIVSQRFLSIQRNLKLLGVIVLEEAVLPSWISYLWGCFCFQRSAEKFPKF